MTKKLILTFILIITLIVVGSGCKKQEATTSPTPETSTTGNENLAASNLTAADPTAVDTIVQKNYNLAKAKAQEWKPDAVLVSLSVKFPSDLAVGSSDETYIFGSAKDTANWWSFSISEQTSRYIRAIIPKEDYLGTDVTPINITYWKSNYGKAFQIAEANGGAAFRVAHPNSSVTATLHNTQPKNWLWWEITYKSSDAQLIIKVNPNTGEAVDESGNPLTNTAATSTTAATATPISQ